MENKVETIVNLWNKANIAGRYNLLNSLGLVDRIRVDNRLFEELPQRDMRTIIHTAEVVL